MTAPSSVDEAGEVGLHRPRLIDAALDEQGLHAHDEGRGGPARLPDLANLGEEGVQVGDVPRGVPHSASRRA